MSITASQLAEFAREATNSELHLSYTGVTLSALAKGNNMKTYEISASKHVAAPAKHVYSIISDYRNGHPHILPKQFTGFQVEKGGVGAGTVIRFQMTVMGRTQTFRAAITEPEPGRVLVETGVETGTVTTFTVNPTSNGDHSNVTIATELKSRNGFLGILERFTTTRLLNRIYKEELKLIQTLADEPSRP